MLINNPLSTFNKSDFFMICFFFIFLGIGCLVIMVCSHLIDLTNVHIKG